MAKSVMAARAAAAKNIAKPYTGTVPDPGNTPAGYAAAVQRGVESGERVQVDHALQPGAYDRIKRG